MDERLSRRERKKLETRQRLMASALRLFRDRGYDTTTVEEITGAASVAKGTFFNYFETKEAILPALAEWRLRQIGEALAPERGAPSSPASRVKMTLVMVADDLLANYLPARCLFSAVVAQKYTQPGRALTMLLAEQVQQAQGAGEIRGDLDPVHVGGMIRALFFQQLILWHRGYRPAPLPQLLDSLVDLLMDGIAGPKWGQTS